MRQTTEYPRTDQIEIEVDPTKETTFTIALRIPAWSKIATVSVNGRPEAGVLQGAYLPVNRKWKKGDRITVKLDLRARLVERNQAQAIVRGPLVLARDSRFGDGSVDEASVVVSKDGYVELTPVEAPDFAWLAFTARWYWERTWKATGFRGRFISAILLLPGILGTKHSVTGCGCRRH